MKKAAFLVLCLFTVSNLLPVKKRRKRRKRRAPKTKVVHSIKKNKTKTNKSNVVKKQQFSPSFPYAHSFPGTWSVKVELDNNIKKKYQKELKEESFDIGEIFKTTKKLKDFQHNMIQGLIRDEPIEWNKDPVFLYLKDKGNIPASYLWVALNEKGCNAERNAIIKRADDRWYYSKKESQLNYLLFRSSVGICFPPDSAEVHEAFLDMLYNLVETKKINELTPVLQSRVLRLFNNSIDLYIKRIVTRPCVCRTGKNIIQERFPAVTIVDRDLFLKRVQRYVQTIYDVIEDKDLLEHVRYHKARILFLLGEYSSVIQLLSELDFSKKHWSTEDRLCGSWYHALSMLPLIYQDEKIDQKVYAQFLKKLQEVKLVGALFHYDFPFRRFVNILPVDHINTIIKLCGNPMQKKELEKNEINLLSLFGGVFLHFNDKNGVFKGKVQELGKLYCESALKYNDIAARFAVATAKNDVIHPDERSLAIWKMFEDISKNMFCKKNGDVLVQQLFYNAQHGSLLAHGMLLLLYEKGNLNEGEEAAIDQLLLEGEFAFEKFYLNPSKNLITTLMILMCGNERLCSLAKAEHPNGLLLLGLSKILCSLQICLKPLKKDSKKKDSKKKESKKKESERVDARLTRVTKSYEQVGTGLKMLQKLFEKKPLLKDILEPMLSKALCYMGEAFMEAGHLVYKENKYNQYYVKAFDCLIRVLTSSNIKRRERAIIDLAALMVKGYSFKGDKRNHILKRMVGKPISVKTGLEILTGLSKKNPRADFTLGLIYGMGGNIDLGLYHMGLAKDHNYKDAETQYYSLLIRNACSVFPGQKNIHKEETIKATNAYTRWVKRRMQDKNNKTYLTGLEYMKKKKFDEAVDLLEECVGNFYAFGALIDCYIQKGDLSSKTTDLCFHHLEKLLIHGNQHGWLYLPNSEEYVFLQLWIGRLLNAHVVKKDRNYICKRLMDIKTQWFIKYRVQMAITYDKVNKVYIPIM